MNLCSEREDDVSLVDLDSRKMYKEGCHGSYPVTDKLHIIRDLSTTQIYS